MSTMQAEKQTGPDSLPRDDEEQIETTLKRNHNAESASDNESQQNGFFNVPDDPFGDEIPEEETEDANLKRPSVFVPFDVDEIEENEFKDQGNDKITKSAAEAKQLIRAIRRIILFEGYDEEELRTVVGYMFSKAVTCGEVVIQRGEIGDALYVVRRGRFQCLLATDETGEESVVREYNNEGYFGELALINQSPRAATIRAVSDGALWVLKAKRYMWFKRRHAVENAERFEQMIKSIPMFYPHLNPSLISRLIDSIEVMYVDPGEVLCRQGEPGDAMYFVMSGLVEATIDNHPVKKMGPNQFFGERALIHKENRAATCTALEKSRLAKFSSEGFAMLIPDEVVARMRKNLAEYCSKEASLDDATDDTISAGSVCMEYYCQELRK